MNHMHDTIKNKKIKRNNEVFIKIGFLEAIIHPCLLNNP